MLKAIYGIAAAGGVFALTAAATANQLVYVPVNPTFGGNPLNGSFLMSTGQAQGHGAGSGGPDLSGLDNALSGLSVGTPIIINLPSTPTTPGNP